MILDRLQVAVLSSPVTKPVLLSAVSGVTGTLGTVALVFQPIDLSTMLIALGMLLTAIGTLYTALHTSKIEGHVDGLASAAAAKRTADEHTIQGLKQQLADAEQRAALLAQAATAVAITAALPLQPSPKP